MSAIEQSLLALEDELCSTLIFNLASDDVSEPPSIDDIKEQIEFFTSRPRSKFRLINPDNFSRIADRIVSEMQITMMDPRIITDQDTSFEPWWHQARADSQQLYWKSYREFLLRSSSMPLPIVDKLDTVSNQILDLCENPQKPGTWSRKGMVVGHVQSGKTANYIGLLAKAADAGYKVIIILTGTLNDLRRQTQARIEDWVKFIETKNHQSLTQTPIPTRWTSKEKDFSKAAATQQSTSISAHNVPIILAIKKNTKTLKELVDWLRGHNTGGSIQKIPHSILLIDDEADYASVNTKASSDENSPSAINGWIRRLLHLFEQRTYVGYTATPFANIFIDPDQTSDAFNDDIFPEHFIVNLEAPSNYFGPSTIFGEVQDSNDNNEHNSPYVRIIQDPEAPELPLSHKKVFAHWELRDDLKEAIRSFFLALTIRKHRECGRGFNASMLIHASRFTEVQRSLAQLVDSERRRYLEAFESYGACDEESALRDPIIRAFRDTYEREFEHLENVPPWTWVQNELRRSIDRTDVRTINYGSKDTLDYDRHKDGLHVIAVGGNALSRGLTLEGLIVSYFLRNTRAYDTLMQMGRWFGYRNGYQDLCRIWMTESLEGAFEHITDTMAELREQFDELFRSRRSPRDFVQRVRTHPDNLLMVTARNKMGNTVEVDISLDRSFIETHIVDDSDAARAQNKGAVRSLAAALRESYPEAEKTTSPAGWLYRDIDAEHVIDFLARYRNSELSTKTASPQVEDFISRSKLRKWDIFFPSLAETDNPLLYDTSLTGHQITFQHRSLGAKDAFDESSVHISDKQRVAGRGVEKIGLSDEQISAAHAAHTKTVTETPGYVATTPEGKERIINFPDRIYRRYRPRPLLIVHLLNLHEKSAKTEEPANRLDPRGLTIAWSISFPESTSERRQTVKYRVNASQMRSLNGDFSIDMADDEDQADD